MPPKNSCAARSIWMARASVVWRRFRRPTTSSASCAPGIRNAAWSGLADELVHVSVDGARLDALAADLDAIKGAMNDEPVRLLPLFDPYLLGHASRDHLFERVHAPKVSRTAGWISAVVLVEGSVAGTWTTMGAVAAGRCAATRSVTSAGRSTGPSSRRPDGLAAIQSASAWGASGALHR